MQGETIIAVLCSIENSARSGRSLTSVQLAALSAAIDLIRASSKLASEIAVLDKDIHYALEEDK